YDRYDYPAMSGGGDRVLGELWEFDTSVVANVLKRLDAIEGTHDNGPDDLYHRVIVETFDRGAVEDVQSLGQAYTYHYVGNPIDDGFRLVRPDAANGYVAWPAPS
ncbi:MAG: gamma-glutamylcyclotransferase, partial [Pirellulaceae bacterium]|nr:gamma-glutamylcyclotransferase [Pirellulaceae bacterium]